MTKRNRHTKCKQYTKDKFFAKISYMAAADSNYDVSIFMNAMDNSSMKTTMEDLLKENNGDAKQF